MLLTSKMEIFYKKNDNKRLFESFLNEDLLNLENVQNYLPIYKKYFSLNENNFDLINLNQKHRLIELFEKKSFNKYECLIHSETNKANSKEVFFKMSPLIDPVQYVIGKLNINDDDLSKLPNLDTDITDRTNNDNHSAYTDGFFSYLSSQLLNEFNFIHGLDFYGSFLGIKNDYKFNVTEDLEYLVESDHFHNNKDVLFQLDNNFHDDLINFDTRTNKKRIKINQPKSTEDNILNLSDINDLKQLDSLFIQNNENDSKMELLFKTEITDNTKTCKTNDESSECSSNSSNTKDDESESFSDSESYESESGSDLNSSDLSTATEDETNLVLPKYPVHLIALESCEQTFENLILKNDLTDSEWESAIFQIIISLIAYQKTFNFTHNDLHTSNIMYISTDKPYFYYKVNNVHYKIQTYGRLFKIIDFGRAIYKFKGNLICSDSFESKGDAAGQYNIEPFFNDKKPRLEPNLSFDICRLGCSIFDFIVDDLTAVDKIRSPIKKLIISWCYDDKHRNILYKTSGKERYPEFKLYKMISRTVHNYIPSEVIQNNIFNKYVVSKKQIKSKTIINIDNLPCLC